MRAASENVSRRTNHATAWPLALALAAAGTAASAIAVAAAIASFHQVAAATGRLQVAGVPFSYPRLNGPAWILLVLALIGAAALGITLRALLRQHVAYRRLLARLDVVGRLEDHPGVEVIADPRPQAFCAGYVRPRVFISEAALELLDEPELEVVLAHEHHHRRMRDPLRFACGRMFGQGLFFVPALRALFRRYADVAELNADGAAVREGANKPAALASALLTFEASGAGVAPERVDALLGGPIGWRRPWRLLALSVGSLASLVSLTWATSQAASARATLALPLLSSQPCLAVLVLVPFVACIIAIGRRMPGWRVAASLLPKAA